MLPMLLRRRRQLAFVGCRLLSASAPRRALPVVGVIDMENREGEVYTPQSAAEQIEQHELEGVAQVVYTGAASVEAADRELLASLSAVLLRRCAFGREQLALLPQVPPQLVCSNFSSKEAASQRCTKKLAEL